MPPVATVVSKGERALFHGSELGYSSLMDRAERGSEQSGRVRLVPPPSVESSSGHSFWCVNCTLECGRPARLRI
jgi:hypothetical protein